jgi:sulfate permease, SulP family
MALEVAAGWAPTRLGLRSVLRDVLSGAICSILSVAYCLSYAALVFSGLLANWLSYGITATFLSAAIAAAVVALRSSFPFAIAGPDTSTSAVTATLAASMAARLAAEGNANLLPSTLIVIALATAATGILLCVLGYAKAGRAIRYVPYPVIGGFLGATGWFMISGAVQLITDQRPMLATIETFAAGPIIAKLAAGLAVAFMLEALLSRWTNAFVLPAILVAALLAIHIALPIAGFSLADAQLAGWMFQSQPTASIVSPLQPAELRTFPWTALPWLAGDVLAVMFVTTISLLLNVTGVEMATRRDSDIDRELRALGVASLLSSACGGYVSCLSLSRTTLSYALGATGRLAGLTVATISAMALFVDPGFLGYVPKYALGGLLLFAGGRLFYRWVVTSAFQLQALDYLSLVIIAVIILRWGFIAGVLVGLIIGCTTFALSASRVNAVKFSFDGSEYRSSVDRSPVELSLLTAYGGELQGMALQSYLFFGSTSRLYEHVKTLLASRPQCRFLLFDFRLVTGIDSSATHNFTQIKEAATDTGARLVLVNLGPEQRRVFHTNRLDTEDIIVAPDLDHALESCEEAIIKAHLPNDSESRSLEGWLTNALGSAEYASQLAQHCTRREVKADQDIARQGEPSDSMHFILQGRVGVFVGTQGDRIVRVRSLGRHTMIGEMGMISGRPRSATIRAEIDSVLYELPRNAYRDLVQQNPDVAQALLKFVIDVMSERLSFANRAISALQR